MSHPNRNSGGTPQTPRARRTFWGCTRVWCLLWTVLAGLYLPAVLILEYAVGDSFVPAYVARYAPQLLFVLPMGVPLFFAVICWRKRLIWVNLALIAVGVGALMPPSFPARRPRTQPAERIRVATWNVHEEFRNAAALRVALAEQAPQIVCLQEARRDIFGTVLRGAEAAHTHEVTTLTTGHIEAERAIRLGPYPNYRWGLETRIRLPQGRLTVLNVHFLTAFTGRSIRRHRHDLEGFLRRTAEARRLEAEVVREWLEHTAGPRLVMGDFNSPPGSDPYRHLAAAATDAFDVCGLGWGYTYRRDHPMIRIDHVFCSPEVTPVRLRAVRGGLSDHLLVVADIVLPQ